MRVLSMTASERDDECRSPRTNGAIQGGPDPASHVGLGVARGVGVLHIIRQRQIEQFGRATETLGRIEKLLGQMDLLNGS